MYSQLGLPFHPTDNNETESLPCRMKILTLSVAVILIIFLSIGIGVGVSMRGRQQLHRDQGVQTTTRPTFLLQKPVVGNNTLSNGTLTCHLPLFPVYNRTDNIVLEGTDDSVWGNSFFLDSKKNLYIIEKVNYSVIKFIPNSKTGIIVAKKSDIYPKLRVPKKIFVDSNDNVFVLENNLWDEEPPKNQYRVLVFWPMKHNPQLYEGTEFINGSGRCYGISMDSDANFYTAEYDNHRVLKWLAPFYNSTVVVAGNETESLRPDLLSSTSEDN
ncbi:unnamed protein product [Rotaria sp. Silwood1]|nr:unnamed protein product [Rotaria sp. Silwood1]